jgi:hypothetical protein
VFSRIDRLWGPHTIDRFARFNCRWWVPGTDGIDSKSWDKENNLHVPPPRLVVHCINKISKEHIKCTLVLPKWKSAPFWPMLINENGNFKFFLKQVLNLYRTYVVVGNGYYGTFDNKLLKFNMIALRIIN